LHKPVSSQQAVMDTPSRTTHPARIALTLPPRGWALVALCTLYLLAGLTGHDPWKNDDAVHFGVVYGFIDGGNWLVPRLVGIPILDTPPLYYWIAALCVKLLGWLLPLHDAARLASGLFGALFLGLLAYAGKLMQQLEYADRKQDKPAGGETGRAAILIAIGCLGLLVPIHDTQPLVALLAASAAVYAGLLLLPQRALPGGMLAGLGIGLGFLASGLLALITLLPVLLILPLNRHWRSASSLRGFVVTFAVALPLCLAWPLLLAWQAPDMLDLWWATALAGVHYQSHWPGALANFAELLAWFTWPALPLAVWALWRNRHRLSQPGILLPLTGTLTALLLLVLFSEPRPLQALPLLVPLILLAANSAGLLQRGAANAFDWFGMMTFSIVAGLIWLGGIAMTSGIPAQIARNFAKLEPGFVAHFSVPAYVCAALLTLAWCGLIIAGPRSPWRSATNWAAGMTLSWALLIALWLPWIDYGKSYRAVAVSLKQAIAENSRQHGGKSANTGKKSESSCIAGLRLGNAQRVSLQYFAGIVTRRTNSPSSTTCSLLLMQTSPGNTTVPAGWTKVWEGHRPGDRSEILRLYNLMK
jgi:4-amino-4-deoxy-L-arabinose transferase-like glycosyltransferase